MFALALALCHFLIKLCKDDIVMQSFFFLLKSVANSDTFSVVEVRQTVGDVTFIVGEILQVAWEMTKLFVGEITQNDGLSKQTVLRNSEVLQMHSLRPN